MILEGLDVVSQFVDTNISIYNKWVKLILIKALKFLIEFHNKTGLYISYNCGIKNNMKED